MKKLTREEFKQTIAEPQQLTEGEPPVDFWPMVEQIPAEDFEGHDCRGGEIHNVYRMQGNDFEHVLIRSTTPDVFMAIVNDLAKGKVHGYCLLDFKQINSGQNA